MGLTEIQKQTIAQRSIRAIAAEVGVDKGTVLSAKQKIKPIICFKIKNPPPVELCWQKKGNP
jgi:hypothetical protein